MNFGKLVNIVLVTGFLGSGKTTFLNYVISNFKNHGISLILNEFGDVKIESNFITEEGVGEIAELSNGCMCCVAKSDIPRVVNYIIEKSPNTEYIFIEASGLSDPDPIKDILIGGVGNNVKYLLNICIVDAKNFFELKDKHPLVMSQAGEADIIILSKTALIEKRTVDKVKHFLESIFEGTLIFDSESIIDIYNLFNVEGDKDSLNNHLSEKEHHEHDNYIETIVKLKNKTDKDTIERIFKRIKYVIRAKGYFEDNSNVYSLQYSGNELEMKNVKSIKNKEGFGVLLFITKNEDKSVLLKTLHNLMIQ